MVRAMMKHKVAMLAIACALGLAPGSWAQSGRGKAPDDAAQARKRQATADNMLGLAPGGKPAPLASLPKVDPRTYAAPPGYVSPRSYSAMPVPTTKLAPGEKLQGSSIYVYTFLDVRDAEFGRKVIDQFELQIVDALAAKGIRAKALRFKRSSVGAGYISPPASTTGGNWFSGYSYGKTDVVPVEQVVASNVADELAVGARYRLLVLPSSYNVYGSWQHYTLRWVLMDIKSGGMLWSHSYSGKHLMLWKPDENSVKRARKLVDGGLSELISSPLYLNAAAPE